MVVTRQNDESDGQQIWNDLELAQWLSLEASHCGLDSQGQNESQTQESERYLLYSFFFQCNIQKG